LIKELQSLGMDVKILSGNEQEIEMRDLEDDEDTVQSEAINIGADQASEEEKVKDAVTKE
jgi:DNA-directed RNA polymerase subunit beta